MRLFLVGVIGFHMFGIEFELPLSDGEMIVPEYGHLGRML
jgi:hypothetical protein